MVQLKRYPSCVPRWVKYPPSLHSGIFTDDVIDWSWKDEWIQNPLNNYSFYFKILSKSFWHSHFFVQKKMKYMVNYLLCKTMYPEMYPYCNFCNGYLGLTTYLMVGSCQQILVLIGHYSQHTRILEDLVSAPHFLST